MGVWRHSDHTIHAVSDPCHLRNTLLVGCLCFGSYVCYVTIPYSGFASCGTADDEYIALSEFASIEDGQCKSCALSLTLVLLLQIITVEEAKRRKSVCSYYGEEDDDDALPVLKHHSALLENMHIEQVWLEKKNLVSLLDLLSVGRSATCDATGWTPHCLSLFAVQLARRLPARVQGYPWRLAYSTLEHGTSLKTLYRKSASLDSPVLLVIKDMDNQVRERLLLRGWTENKHVIRKC